MPGYPEPVLHSPPAVGASLADIILHAARRTESLLDVTLCTRMHMSFDDMPPPAPVYTSIPHLALWAGLGHGHHHANAPLPTAMPGEGWPRSTTQRGCTTPDTRHVWLAKL